MTSFATITPEEYRKLVDNERKIFNLTKNFATPEILNKYRHTDENIDKKIKKDEKIKENYENLDKIINKNVDKLKPIKANKQISTEDYSDDDSIISDKTEYDYNDIMSKMYGQNYRFDNDDEILNSFSKIFKEYDIEYNPRPNTRYYRVRYFLNKLKENENIPVNLYNYFHTTLSEKKTKLII